MATFLKKLFLYVKFHRISKSFFKNKNCLSVFDCFVGLALKGLKPGPLTSFSGRSYPNQHAHVLKLTIKPNNIYIYHSDANDVPHRPFIRTLNFGIFSLPST